MHLLVSEVLAVVDRSSARIKMSLVERYRRSHRYRKWKLAILEFFLIVSIPGAVAGCIWLSGSDGLTQASASAFYLSVPCIIYGAISQDSQFLTPRFARVTITRSDREIVITVPGLRWVLFPGPLMVAVAAVLVVTFAEPELLSRWGDGSVVMRALCFLGLVLMLPFSRSRSSMWIRRRAVDGNVVIGPLNATYKIDPVESIRFGVPGGVRGDGYVDRRWFGGAPRRGSFAPPIELAVLNNAYASVEVSDVSEIADVEVGVG